MDKVHGLPVRPAAELGVTVGTLKISTSLAFIPVPHVKPELQQELEKVALQLLKAAKPRNATPGQAARLVKRARENGWSLEESMKF